MTSRPSVLLLEWVRNDWSLDFDDVAEGTLTFFFVGRGASYQ